VGYTVREFHLKPQTKVRVWLCEQPNAIYHATTTIEQSFPAINVPASGLHCYAAEYLSHTGGHCPYGLLGCCFTSNESTELRVEIAVADPNGPLFLEALAGPLDQVRVGLPGEFVSGVTTGIMLSNANVKLGAGVLRYNCAAHGLIGSSPDAFRRLTYLLVELIQIDNVAVADDDIIRAIERSMFSS
jgi:hypothetical protein